MALPCPTNEDFPLAYTCETCMARLFSQDGIDLRTDDTGGTKDDMVDDAIMDATDMINQHCLGLYPDTELFRSRWVSRRACYLACHFLSQRRGNPAQYQDQYERIERELKQVQELIFVIPRIRPRNEVTPSMSNLVVDDRYCQQKIRAVKATQVGEDYNEQHADYPRGACGYCGYL